jgi:hypothetical protein
MGLLGGRGVFATMSVLGLVTLALLVLIGGFFGVGTGEERRGIPTTLDGPFKPYTKAFDASLRTGSDDLPLYDPRVVKRVPAIFPEQISLALSTPDAMWVSWVSGKPKESLSLSSPRFSESGFYPIFQPFFIFIFIFSRLNFGIIFFQIFIAIERCDAEDFLNLFWLNQPCGIRILLVKILT